MPVTAVLFTEFRCPNCAGLVRVSKFQAAIFNLLILIVTLATSGMIFLQAGLYAAIVWLPFPIGALSYLKARFCSLDVRPAKPPGA